ncbi:uncharacterized protein LOC142087457 isoform X4 [Calonectris borealis]|uniref:uncharacterized protein LOC142087457 isoform X4 n=1 Tax=Calonectris borealis TaxID=1323832 RepID=UPI003F4C13D1
MLTNQGDEHKIQASPSASREENPVRLTPLAAQNVNCHRFTVVALSFAMKVQDRWKGSIVVCKYKAFPRSINSLVTGDRES